jgi:EmrB/QacA subfamily drug resistance transporter
MSESVETAGRAETPTSPGLSHRQIMTVISGLLLGVLLAALDQTIVSTAMRTIADQLHGQTIQAWATTAYLITMTVSTPLYGKLSDIFGRKPMYLTAISIFLAGSLLCGIAGSMYELAAYRAVQGAGAGGLMSLALAIIADLVSQRERGRYQGYFMGVWGVASVAGPLVGGTFAGLDSLAGLSGWRWVFLVNVPVALVALAVVTRVLNVPHRKVAHRIDYWGAAALAVCLVPLLIVAEQGRDWGWLSTGALSMYGISLVGLAAFLRAEQRMGDEALLPLRLFRNSVFTLSNIVGFIMGIGMFGGLMSLPLYLQIVKGASPTQAGLMTLPLTAGILGAGLGSGRLISRTGRYRIFPIIGMGAMVGAMLLFAQIGTTTPVWQTMIVMVVMGIGLGLCMQTLILAIQAASPARDTGVATASATFFRSIGGTAGTAIFLSILFGVVGDRIAAAFTAARTDPAFLAALGDPANAAYADGIRGAGLDLNNTEFLEHMDPVLARPILDGFSSAMNTVFLVGAVVLFVGWVLVWLIKEMPLSQKSGLERAEAEAAAVH